MKKYKKIYIEITNVCNLSCRFCPLTSRKKEFLNRDGFNHILKEIKPYGEYIYFHLMGEPLLNQDLGYFLERAKEEGFKSNITTNGTLINKNRETLLNAEGLRQINISLHSFEANEAKVELDEYINNIILFIKEGLSKTKTIYALRLWNEDGALTIGENKLNNMILEELEKAFELNFDLNKKFKEDKRVKIKDRVYVNGGEKFEWPSLDRDIISDTGFCYGLRDQFGILVDGTVVPCCLDGEGKIPLGNIYEESLDNILNSERAANLYDGFTNRKKVEELCKKCGYSTVFSK